LRSGFSQDGQQVGLYLAYYRNQDYDHKLVSSSNVLVASSDPQWRRVDSGVRQIAFGEQPVQVRTAELRSGETSRMVVWQLYWINGYLTSSDYVAKAYTAFSRLLGRGDDSAVIIVYAPKELSGDADTVLQRFVVPAAAVIESALSRTREMR
jgi:EpsI family protein